MRIYQNCYDLMSEMGRNLWEMGAEVAPHSYQNKTIVGDEQFLTKELICEQYCLTSLDREEFLFKYSNSKDWADAELKERLEFGKGYYPRSVRNPGEAWKLRPDIWEQFLNREGEFDYTYAERIHSSQRLDRVISELKINPDTRQGIIMIHNEKDVICIGGKARIPCTMYYNFLVRNNSKGEKVVNIVYHQRSSDFITHFGNDVYLAWKLMEYVAKETGYGVGKLYHTIDSIHAYQKDWTKLKTSLR